MDPHASAPIDRLLAHRAWVRRVARAIARNDCDADDLEQGFWLHALRRPPTSCASLRGWIVTALRRDRTDAWRSEACRVRREEATARGGSAPAALEIAAAADSRDRVVRAVMDLPDPYRSAILCRYFEDLQPSEIAARLGVPVETVRTRLRRALARLRECLESGDGGDPPRGASSVAVATGGVLMGAKLKAAGVLAALLLIGAALWRAVGPPDASRGVDPSGADDAWRSPVHRAPDTARSGARSRALRPTEATQGRPGDPAAAPPATDAASFAVAGVVRESAGESAPQTTVVLLAAIDRAGIESRTDEAGRFGFPAVAPGEYVVEARPAARAPASRRVVVPPTGGVADLEIRLAPARRVTVFVTDEADRPVPGAPVVIRRGPAGSAAGHTDDAGRWSASLDGPGTITVGTIDPARLVAPAPIAVPEGSDVIRFVLREGRIATGTVLDPDGSPIAGAEIEVVASGAARRVVRCDSGGEFQVTVPLTGSVDLAFAGSAFVEGALRRLPFEGRVGGVRAGDRGVVLRTSRESRAAGVDVVVFGPSGAPIEGARAWLSGRIGEILASAHTDAAGRVRLDAVPDRTARLWVDTSRLPRGSRFAVWGPREVVPSGGVVEVRLVEARRISGLVTDASGAPAGGAVVSAVRGPAQVAITFAEEDGTFELAIPPESAGAVTVRASRRGADGTRRVAELMDVVPGTDGLRLTFAAR